MPSVGIRNKYCNAISIASTKALGFTFVSFDDTADKVDRVKCLRSKQQDRNGSEEITESELPFCQYWTIAEGIFDNYR